jgi:hypothetical protein
MSTLWRVGRGRVRKAAREDAMLCQTIERKAGVLLVIGLERWRNGNRDAKA